jgi:16S rRNA (uracil1498-N3)-methyltransferase
MKQFILTEEPDKDGSVRLRDDDFHYLVTVRRLRPGGVIKVLDNGGTAFALTVLSIDNNTLLGRISPWTPDISGSAVTSGHAGIPSVSPIPPIILFQALPKGPKMDTIVRQAAEGALEEVVPFVSEHSLPRGKSGAAEDRWRRIIKEARQQSGSPVDTQIRSVLTLDEALAYWETLQGGSSGALALLLHEQPIAKAPLEQGTFHGYLYGDPQLVVVAVGPEGGFSAAEVRRFSDAGFKPLYMGETVLRSDTAALYGTAAVRIILLENASWMLKK